MAERERALSAQTEQLQLVSQHQFEMQAQLGAVQKALQEQQVCVYKCVCVCVCVFMVGCVYVHIYIREFEMQAELAAVQKALQ